MKGFTITPKQQKKLFKKVYKEKANYAKRIYKKYSTDKNNKLKLDTLSPVAKDVAVDIIYRGEYAAKSKNIKKRQRSQRIQKVLESKSIQKLKDLMTDRKFWKEAGTDNNRYNIRKKAVEAACKQDPNCK